jgi:hypothetical protein
VRWGLPGIAFVYFGGAYFEFADAREEVRQMYLDAGYTEADLAAMEAAMRHYMDRCGNPWNG